MLVSLLAGVGSAVDSWVWLVSRCRRRRGWGVCAGGGDGGAAVPAPPAGGSGLGSGAGVAGGVYGQTQAAVGGLDADSGHSAGQADGVGAAGRAGSGAVRDSARIRRRRSPR